MTFSNAFALGQRIADKLSSEGYHGKFTVTQYWWPTPSEGVFRAWHLLSAEFEDDGLPIDIEAAQDIVDEFNKRARLDYKRKAIIQVRLAYYDSNGDIVEEDWRAVTSAEARETAVSQFHGALSTFAYRYRGLTDEYEAKLTGVAFRLEATGRQVRPIPIPKSWHRDDGWGKGQRSPRGYRKNK